MNHQIYMTPVKAQKRSQGRGHGATAPIDARKIFSWLCFTKLSLFLNSVRSGEFSCFRESHPGHLKFGALLDIRTICLSRYRLFWIKWTISKKVEGQSRWYFRFWRAWPLPPEILAPSRRKSWLRHKERQYIWNRSGDKCYSTRSHVLMRASR